MKGTICAGRCDICRHVVTWPASWHLRLRNAYCPTCGRRLLRALRTRRWKNAGRGPGGPPSATTVRGHINQAIEAEVGAGPLAYALQQIARESLLP